jgi:hypothetical protein
VEGWIGKIKILFYVVVLLLLVLWCVGIYYGVVRV